MRIVVNGDSKDVPSNCNLAELLEQYGLAPPRVAIEVNEQLVRRSDYQNTPIREGDRIEIVTLVGGG